MSITGSQRLKDQYTAVREASEVANWSPWGLKNKNTRKKY